MSNTSNQPYPQLTPPVRARGRWKVREPFRIVETDTYTCIAIRNFRDIVNEGVNPYSDIYLPVGLINGQMNNGRTFDFAQETLRGINIVSLESDNGIIVHVPDNYILSFPDSSIIKYSRVVLSADLGFIPSSLDLETVRSAVRSTIMNYLGITNPVVNMSEAPARTMPTYEEHLAFEKVRKNAIKLVDTPEIQQQQLINRIKDLEETNAALTKICIDNNYIGT